MAGLAGRPAGASTVFPELALFGPPAGPSITVTHAIATGMFSDVADKATFKVWQNPDEMRAGLTSGTTRLALAMAGEVLALSQPVTGFLWIAAGAAFVDRVGEAFIGREAFRAEIAVIATACGLAGAGLMLTGASRLGAPISETSAIHVIVMGGLGVGVLAVMSIAGRLHTGQPLQIGPRSVVAFGAFLLG